jgi:hypothetical protein
VDLDVIFAYVVGVLAALAVIGALVFVIVAEVCAIKRTLATHRQPATPPTWWRERGALAPTIPERRP